MLGTDPEAAKLLKGVTNGTLPMGVEGPSTGWLTTIVILGGAWLLLGGGGLFSLPTLIGVGAVAYLVHSRDYRLAHLLQYPGSARILYGVVAVGALLVLLRLLRPRYYYPGMVGRSFGISGAALRSVLMCIGGAVALFTVFLILTNPTQLEHAIPGWRSGAAVAMLLGSLYALGISLPQRWRAVLTPLFWGSVCVVIGVQIFAPTTVSRALPRMTYEQF